ncbi:MAG: hypothetical protein ABIO37_10455 [Caulobacteraceae bacterium]
MDRQGKCRTTLHTLERVAGRITKWFEHAVISLAVVVFPATVAIMLMGPPPH